MRNLILGSLLVLDLSCVAQQNDSIPSSNGHTISSRFSPPKEFKRTGESLFSFGTYLRDLPLKKPGSLVNYYNGGTKPNTNIYAAVVDLPIGKKVFVLAQSYMPAQETQVLWNTNEGKKTVWYPLDFGGLLVTPEYSFYPKELMRF